MKLKTQLVMIFIACYHFAFSQVNPTSDPYKWSRVNVAGGGYMTGIFFHPQQQGLKYIRTDVVPSYRQNSNSDEWTYLGDKFSPDFQRMGGSDGMALHPTDTNLVYSFIGGGNTDSAMGLYRSFNQGDDWELVMPIWTDGNAKPTANKHTRAEGEPLVIDPNNTNYIYAGTQRNGVFKSTTGGGSGTWSQITSIPEDGINKVGTRCMAIDPNFTIGSPARSKYIFASVFNQGLFLSIDGGNTFSLMANSPTQPTRMKFGPDGALYVTSDSGFWKFVPGTTTYENGTWTNISPDGQNSTTNFASFDVRETANGLQFIVTHPGGAGATISIWRKPGNNSQWQLLTKENGKIIENVANGFDYIRDPGSGNISDIKFDPFSNDVWFTDVYMVWKCTEFWGGVTEWEAQYKRLNNTISIDLSAPPASEDGNAGILYTSHPDVEGFRFADVNDPWTTKFSAEGPNATGIDFCEEYPNNIYFCKAWKWDPKYQGRVFRSDDGITQRAPGENFVDVSSYHVSFPHDDPNTPENDAFDLEVGGAKIAVSATDPMNAVYFSGAFAKGTKYTLDGGNTWLDCVGLPTGGFVRRSNCGGCNEYDFPMPLAADRIDGSVFYAYYDIDHTFWRSMDKGATWEKMNTASNNLPAWQGQSQYDPYRMEAAPFIAGTVWIALDDNGLWASSNYGESFTKISYFDKANQVAWGKNKPGNSNPTAYVYGLVGSQWGIYRSTNMGTSWELITPADLPGAYPRNLAGDRQVYGRVYAGHASAGVRFGELSNPPTPEVAPHAPTLVSVEDLTTSSVKLKWVDNATNENKFRIYRKGPGESTFKKVGLTGFNDSTFVDEGVLPGLTYEYFVRAWNDGGNGDSQIQSIRMPRRMRSLILLPSCSKYPEIDRRWRIYNPNPFPIQVSWEVHGTSQVGELIAPPGHSFFITATVEGFNINKIFWTDEYGKTKKRGMVSGGIQCDLNVPAEPDNFVAVGNHNDNPITGEIILNWNDLATNEDVYEIERMNSSGVYELIATLDSNTTSYTDKDLVTEASFQYRIRAFNTSLGHSQYVSASGTTLNGYYQVILDPGGKVLEPVNPWSNNSNVVTYDWRGGWDKQMWVFEDAGDGYYYIKLKVGDRVLTIANPTSDLNTIDNVVIDWPFELDEQKWKIVKASSSPSDLRYRIINKSSEKYMEAENPWTNNSNVFANKPTGWGKQNWRFKFIEEYSTSNARTPNGLLQEKSLEGEIKIYPNPAHNQIKLKLNTENANLQNLFFTDVSGRRYDVEFKKESGNVINISLDYLGTGLFMLQATIDGQTIIEKVMIYK